MLEKLKCLSKKFVDKFRKKLALCPNFLLVDYISVIFLNLNTNLVSVISESLWTA